jgi:putative oxidoreductase
MLDRFSLALLLLRLLAGGFQLPHGLQKFGLLRGNVAAVTESFAQSGLHPPLAWVRVVGAAQIIAGLCLVLGLATDGAAVLTMCMSAAMVRLSLWQGGWFWNRHGVEYAVFWAGVAAAIALLGPGAWSIDALL